MHFAYFLSITLNKNLSQAFAWTLEAMRTVPIVSHFEDKVYLLQEDQKKVEDSLDKYKGHLEKLKKEGEEKEKKNQELHHQLEDLNI